LLANGQVEFLRRSSTGGSVKSTVSTGSAAPNNWIRLVRSGQKITAYKSSSGTTWTSIGSQSITMASTISFGLVTASGNTNTLSTATIANVSVVP
jgi:regulation of enolase protein 1 (concanavalin A-like superfamily)